MTYDVYFTEGDTSPNVLVSNDQTESSFTPGILLPNTTYSWKIIAIDSSGSISEGPVWTFTTSDGSITSGEMVLIPASEFQMGCDPNHNDGFACEDQDSDQLPLHTVYLSSFLIDKYEVTNSQYANCVAAGECTIPQNFGSETHLSYYGNPDFSNYPVIWVDWYQAIDYCSWAGKRLPTEAEWKKAARGTSPQAYPWGDLTPTCDMANYYLCVNDTTYIGRYSSYYSPYNALDMAGNVWEWVK